MRVILLALTAATLVTFATISVVQSVKGHGEYIWKWDKEDLKIK